MCRAALGSGHHHNLCNGSAPPHIQLPLTHNHSSTSHSRTMPPSHPPYTHTPHTLTPSSQCIASPLPSTPHTSTYHTLLQQTGGDFDQLNSIGGQLLCPGLSQVYYLDDKIHCWPEHNICCSPNCFNLTQCVQER